MAKKVAGKGKKSKREFTKRTRVYDLVKSVHHQKLKTLVESVRPFVKHGESLTWKNLRFFEFDESKISKTKFILIISRFLCSIGKGGGLKCRMSVFVRYLSSNGHSNFGLKERSLNTLIYRQLGYMESAWKCGENL